MGRLSLGKAADTYYKIRDWDNAARVYREYIKTYPQAKDVTMAYGKAAECYERKEDWGNAAAVYMEIAENPAYKEPPEEETGPSLGQNSLFRAGRMYEQLKDWTRAANTFAKSSGSLR